MKKIKINEAQLRARCLQPETEFFDIGEVVPTTGRGVNAQESFYVYKDNGSKILAVAHLDSVIMPEENWTFEKARLGRNGAKQTYIWNPQLDDRLGVYIILDLLPSLIGENQYDILLTTDEEIGATTAEHFVAPEGKQYNWIFQFDRRGTGAVLYSYQGGDWTPAVSEFLTVQQGSFSDISRLEHLGAKALNVGTGYHDEHRDMCYMIVEETEAQVRRFLKFYYTNRDIHFPHTKTTYRATTYGGYSRWNDDDYEGWTGTSSGYWDEATRSWKQGAKPATATDVRNKYLTSNHKLHPSEWIKFPNVCTFTMKMESNETPIMVYSDPVSGKLAVECSICTTADIIESMHWTALDALPVCDMCYNHSKSPEIVKGDFLEFKPEWDYIEEDGSTLHTSDRLHWLMEGGWIKKSGYNWTRITPKWDQTYGSPDGSSRKAISCNRCQQPEWAENAFTEKGAGRKGQDLKYCRWCHAQAANPTEDEETDQSYADDDGMRQPNYAGMIEKAGRVYDETIRSLDNILLLPDSTDTQEVDMIDLQQDSFGHVFDDRSVDGQDWEYYVDANGKAFWTRDGNFIPALDRDDEQEVE